MATYVVVARARASAVFYPGDNFSIDYALDEGQTFNLRFGTTTYEGGFEVPAPKDFWVEARGEAKDLHHAAELFANAALEMSNIIALATNASMGLLEPELVFDVSPGMEHEFLQIFVPDAPLTTIPGRRIDVEIVDALIKAIAPHPHRQRLLRATVQYVEALRSWRPGHEITCLAHLYMGVEALTKAVLREHLHRTGRSENEIEAEWKIERKRLDSETRRRLIFQGDTECFEKARQVSDGFEHGFTDFGEMRKPAHEVIVKTAEYLRHAIIKLVGIKQSLIERALGPNYNEPRGPLRLVRYLRGTLVGEPDHLSAKDQPYPLLEWRTELKTVRIGENGLYQFNSDETLTANFGDNVTFRPGACEVWDGSTIRPTQAPDFLFRPGTASPQRSADSTAS